MTVLAYLDPGTSDKGIQTGLLIAVIIGALLALAVIVVLIRLFWRGGSRLKAAPQDHLAQLQRLTELRDAGTLSPDEFEREKTEIMAARGA